MLGATSAWCAAGRRRVRVPAAGRPLPARPDRETRARDAPLATRAASAVGYRSVIIDEAAVTPTAARTEGTGQDVASSTGDAPQGAGRLGFTSGQVVQEFGYDDDVDEDLRSDLAGITGAELVDEDYDDVVDGVVIWFRDEDGDLADYLMDAMTVLDDGGQMWVLTPKPGRGGHVGHDDIEEAATTAGLHATSTFSIAGDWSATRLGSRGRGR
jgi:hypothetical protein